MGIFRKSSGASDHSNGSTGGDGSKVHLTKDDVKNFKARKGHVQDSILAAVNEQQPFEAAADDQVIDESNISRNSYLGGAALHDVFGKPIQRPDISNPTRARDERPLDTIRSFEYSITGDPSYRDRLETDSLGFRVRQDFPRFGGGNPYNNYDYTNQNQQPVHSFSGDNGDFEQGVYQAPVKADMDDKKKKKGLFGRKKK
jgi:hypothetical protein